MSTQTLVGIIGAGQCDDDVARTAYAVGGGIAAGGYGIVCGGLGGVMEAACHGASDAGGLTVGVLPGDAVDSANPHVQIRIATGMGIARNVIIVRSSAVVIAISGGPGTLSEIAHCLQLGVPVVGLHTHDVSSEMVRMETPQAAVEQALILMAQRS